MKKRGFTFFVLMLPVAVFAQFNEAIGTYKDQVGYSVQATQKDDGFIAAGVDGHTVFGATEAAIVKTKRSGEPQWATVYGGVGYESFKSVREIYPYITLAVDGYAALGTTTSFASNEDLYFVRTDLSGTPIFSFTFGRKEGKEIGHCLQYIKDWSTSGYGYVMVGQTNSYPYFGNSTDILIVKTDENGNLTKAKVIGAPGEDIGYWIEQTRDGGFIVTGSTTGYPGGNNDIFVIRLNKDLELIWQRIYKHCNVPYEDVGYSVVENPLDGSFTVTGFTKSFGLEYSQDAFLLNVKGENGIPNWLRTYGTKEIEQGISLDLSADGREYIVSGFAIHKDGNKDAWIFKTDMAGNPIWSRIYGSMTDPASVEEGAEITSDGRNGFVFTGFTEGPYTINRDFYLVNITFDGDSRSPRCQDKFTREWKQHTPCLAGNFQAVNINDIRSVCTQYERVEYRVGRCSDETTLGTSQESQQETTDAIDVIPNPSSTSIQVLFHDKSIQKNGGRLVVYNRSGKVVYTTSTASDEIRIPVEGLQNDLYMIRFTTKDGKQYQKKFIKK